MDKMIRFVGSFFIFASFNQAFSCNYQLLDIYAENLTEFMRRKSSFSADEVINYLSFLHAENEDEVKKYVQDENFFTAHEKNTPQDLKNFHQVCKEIDEFYAEIDLMTQAAVRMLYEKVAKKVKEQEILTQAFKIALSNNMSKGEPSINSQESKETFLPKKPPVLERKLNTPKRLKSSDTHLLPSYDLNIVSKG